MKCLDKKRIKLKQGETLALNERIMLSLVSTGVRLFWNVNWKNTLTFFSKTVLLLFAWLMLSNHQTNYVLFWTSWMAVICTIICRNMAYSVKQKSCFMPQKSFLDWSTCTTVLLFIVTWNQLIFCWMKMAMFEFLILDLLAIFPRRSHMPVCKFSNFKLTKNTNVSGVHTATWRQKCWPKVLPTIHQQIGFPLDVCCINCSKVTARLDSTSPRWAW